MVYSCIVAGCANKGNPNADTLDRCIIMHRWPDKSKYPQKHAAWSRFVRLTRVDFTEPTTSSRICSQHFKREDYENWIECSIKLSMKQTFRLKLDFESGGIPSVYPASTRQKTKQKEGKRAVPSSSDARKKRREESERRDCVSKAIEGAHDVTIQDDSESEDCCFEEEMDDMVMDDLINDPDYQVEDNDPEFVYECSGRELSDLLNSTSLDESPKLIVAESNLLQLLLYCRKCTSSAEGDILLVMYTQGAVVKYKMACQLCGHTWRWQTIGTTQRDMKHCNALLQSAILYTGSQPVKVMSYMDATHIQFPKATLYYQNQKDIFVPVVHKLWNEEQAQLIQEIKDRGECHVAGDARCDCMGFCAQFGSYSLMDLSSNKLINVEPIAKVETAMNSNAMEMEGLVRGLRKLKDLQVQVDSLVTDRHMQIAAMMRAPRSEFKDIKHYFDVWHVSKSVNKALRKLAGKDGSGDGDNGGLTTERINSITNRLYYMAANTPPGPLYATIMEEKRKAMLSHVIGIHVHPENVHYKKCGHGEVKTLRMDPEHKKYDALKHYLNRPAIKQAVQQLSPVGQTSRLESYHHVILKFAPKHLSFGFQAMTARLLLAAIDYNENCNRPLRFDNEGNELYRVWYVKYNKGKGKAVKVRAAPSNIYVSKLMKYTYKAMLGELHLPQLKDAPPSMTSALENKDDAEAVRQRHRSRFSWT